MLSMVLFHTVTLRLLLLLLQLMMMIIKHSFYFGKRLADRSNGKRVEQIIKKDFLLKTLNGDDAKWKQIRSECNALLEKIKPLGEELNKKIVSDPSIQFMPGSTTQLEAYVVTFSTNRSTRRQSAPTRWRRTSSICSSWAESTSSCSTERVEMDPKHRAHTYMHASLIIVTDGIVLFQQYFELDLLNCLKFVTASIHSLYK